MIKLSTKQKIVINVLLMQLFLMPIFTGTLDDAGTHAARLENLSLNIENLGLIDAIGEKIYYQFLDGAGYAYPMFYGDILLIPFAIILNILRPIGLTAYILYKIILSMQFVAIWGQSYWVLKRLIKQSDTDLIYFLSAVYTLIPYTAYNIVNQSYRILATIFIPIAIYNLLTILNNKKQNINNIIGLSVQMVLILETHLITALLVSIALAIVTLVYIINSIRNKPKQSKETLKNIIKPISSIIKPTSSIIIQAIIAIGLQAHLIFPMFEQLKTGLYTINNISNDLSSSYNTQIIGIFIPEWLWAVFGVILNIPSMTEQNFMSIGFIGFIYLMIFIHGIKNIKQSIIKPNTELKIKTSTKLCIAYPIIYVLFNCTGIAQRIFNFMQFRIRFNTLFDIGLIYIIYLIIKEQKETVTQKRIVNTTMMILAAQLIGVTVYSHMISTGLGDYTLQVGGGGEYLVYNEKYDITEETKNLGLHYDTSEQVNDMMRYKKQFNNNASIETLSGGRVKIYKTTDDWEQAKEKSNSIEEKVEIPVTFYKGYKATDPVNMQELEIQPSDKGFILIDKPSGDIVEIEYIGTLVQELQKIVQMIQLIGVQMAVIINNRQEIENKLKITGGTENE